MPRSGPKRVREYSLEFKLTAVRLSQQPGIQVKTVAAALDIHPFMLSKWRKDVRDGVLREKVSPLETTPAREIQRLQEVERAHAQLQKEHELVKEAIRFCSERKATSSPSSPRKQAHSVRRLCALYGVSAAGYYAWRRRPESARSEQNRKLTDRIQVLFKAHRGCYGSPRIHDALQREGWRVSRRRVERLMRTAGLRARVARIYRSNPALHRFFGQHSNHVGRGSASRPNEIWVGDVTYLRAGRQWCFLAVVLDQCSRRVLAWRLAKRRDSALTARVVAAAARRRRPAKGLIFHSDRGSEYVAAAYGRRLETLGITQSTTRRGPEDNAHMESFFHSLKAEFIHGSTFTSERVLRRELDAYIRYYNRHRSHSALGYRSPVDFEVAAA